MVSKVGVEVLAAVTLNIIIFWDDMSCSLVDKYQCSSKT